MGIVDSIRSTFSTDSSRASNDPSGQPDDAVKSFIAKAPGARYTFDSERDASQSELCRETVGERRRECIMIQMQSKRLFEAMQKNGFFCALPLDPTRTHMECTPIPKQ